MQSDTALFIRRDTTDPRPGTFPQLSSRLATPLAQSVFLATAASCAIYSLAYTCFYLLADLMYHIYSVPFADNTERLGYERPPHAICVRHSLASSDRHHTNLL